MVFVKRDKNNTEDNTENITSESVEGIKPPTFSDVQIQTYRQQACKVLNILESNNINIYEEGRTGGMYLKKTKNDNSEFKTIFKKEQPNTETTKNLDNLFKHFNNKNNG